MSYTNSPLVDCTVLSPNHSGTRTHKIDRITIHVIVGQLSAESIGGCFTSPSREASCNYGIGADGRVCLVVEEKNRSWCSSSGANDQRAITIECASDKTHPYAVNDVVYNKIIDLCVDACKRNGKNKLIWIENKEEALKYEPKENEMQLTVHRWFANKACPGEYLFSRHHAIAAEVTKRLGGSAEIPTQKPSETLKYYRVRKSWDDEKSQIGAYTKLENAKNVCKEGYTVYDWNGQAVYPTPKVEVTPTPEIFKSYMVKIDVSEIYDHCLNIREKPDGDSKKVGIIETDMSLTIVDEAKDSNGKVWGLLKSGERYRNRWIRLDYTKR